MATPYGRQFGHRIWVDVSVVPEDQDQGSSSESESEDPSVQEEAVVQEEEVKEEKEVEDGKWSEALKTLETMGFTDRDTNKAALLASKGNMLRALQMLLGV
jgi:hypothetical protein